MTTPTSVENHLKQLTRFGQSIWLDYIRRDLMTSGELKRLIEEDGLGGMTSNPTIFEKAIAGGGEYAGQLAELRQDKSLDAKAIYERLAIRDIQNAADVLRAVYDDTGGIGKLYARQDEIGTPFCVTVDHQSLEDEAVTVRDRDTWEQERVKVSELSTYLRGRLTPLTA